MNCVPPTQEFLQGVRDICTQYGSLLIIDEVMSGFRVALGGAQAHYNIVPDLTTLGKIIGGGMPVGAFGGRADVMKQLAPLGPVYQAGTLSGNPVAMTAGLVTLEILASDPAFYDRLSANLKTLLDGLSERAKAFDIPFFTTAVGGMFGFFFTEQTRIETLDDVKKCDIARFKKFFHRMLEQGIYLAPSAFEAGFISSAHGEKEIARTLDAAEVAFAELVEMEA